MDDPTPPGFRDEDGGMEAQLASLYAERELLEQELGTADASRIVRMIRSMEEQLIALYGEKQPLGGPGMGRALPGS